ncbi:MAG: phosphoribosylglycinamide formyltransferase, partial [Myxococcales bacterium]|nr:phosphoribosylglycinamide formyltransferase [Myxococcales bacterium]
PKGHPEAEVVGVLSSTPEAPALDFAAQQQISSATVNRHTFKNRKAWSEALIDQCDRWTPHLIVLAGFMKILPPPFVKHFEGQIINIHPSLLPAFPGKDGPADALAHGVRISGCTVHLVDEGIDTGAILAQAAVAVMPDDTRDALHARIQQQEHRLLPGVIGAIARGDLVLSPVPRWEPSASFVEDAITSPSIHA